MSFNCDVFALTGSVAFSFSIEARLAKARMVSEVMDQMMAHEQRFFRRQFLKSQGVKFYGHRDDWL